MIWGLRAYAKSLGLNPDQWAFIPWESLDAALIALGQTRLTETLSPASANTARAALRGTLRAAWRLGLLDGERWRRLSDNPPARGSRQPKGRALTMSEQAKLLEEAARVGGSASVRNVALLCVALGAGLRRAEILGLRPSNFLSEAFGGRGALRFVGKGNREALQPLTRAANQALRQWLDLRGREPGVTFCALREGKPLVEKPLSAKWLSRWLVSLGERSGVGKIAPHDLRRTYATGLLTAGVDVGIVRKLMRHSRLETTLRYDRRDDGDLQRAVDLLP